MEFDSFDKKLIYELQKDADRSNATLADVVGLSPSACLRRVAKLKKAGVIQKTVALVDPTKLGQHLTAVVTVEFVRHAPEYKKEFMKQVKAEDAITQCYVVTGDISCILVLHVKDMAEYTALSERLFDQDRNVVAFFTHFVMHTDKFETRVFI